MDCEGFLLQREQVSKYQQAGGVMTGRDADNASATRREQWQQEQQRCFGMWPGGECSSGWPFDAAKGVDKEGIPFISEGPNGNSSPLVADKLVAIPKPFDARKRIRGNSTA